MAFPSITTLAYHRISDRLIPSGTWVSPRLLTRQLDAIAAAGISFATPSSFCQEIQNKKADDDQAQTRVLVTFDDATEDLQVHADLLRRRNIAPVVFVPVDHVGQANSWEWNIPGRAARHLNETQLREMRNWGWEIGLHGASHRSLKGMSPAELEREIGQGRQKLESLSAGPVRLFSYPFGLVDDGAAKAVQDSGFVAAFVLAGTSAPDKETRYRLARRPVYCIDTAAEVRAKVTDPGGGTHLGRWQLWKERAAHGVGRATAPLLNRTASVNAGD